MSPKTYQIRIVAKDDALDFVQVERLPDAPTEPHLSEKQREWIRVLDETTGTIPGLTVEAYKLDALAKRIAKLEGALGPDVRTFGAQDDAPTLEQARAEAQRPVKSIAYANAQLDEMAKELRDARAEAERLREDLRGTREEVERLRDVVGPGMVDALEDAKRVREERDRLRAERDALACAALGTEDLPGRQVFLGSVEAVLTEIRNMHARDRNRHDALGEIAQVVWPGYAQSSTVYALADLVEAVRKMGAERASLSRNLDQDRADLATLRRMWETVVAERDNAIADQKWARSIVEESRADAEKSRKGWDAAIADRDKLKLRIGEMGEEARIAHEQRNDVIRGKTAAELRANALEDERDALQKRIDAALPHARGLTRWQTGCIEYDGEDDVRHLLAILEGREPGTATEAAPIPADNSKQRLEALVKWVQAEFIKTSEQARQLVRVLEGIDQ